MIIESKRIILRNWEDDDVEDLIEGLNNINVAKWMANVPFPHIEKDARDFIIAQKIQEYGLTKIIREIDMEQKHSVAE